MRLAVFAIGVALLIGLAAALGPVIIHGFGQVSSVLGS